MSAKVRTCLWFDGTGHEAAQYYTSLIPGSGIEGDPAPDALVINFYLAGTPYQALNGGAQFTHSPAASISVTTLDQEETDRLWDALTEEGEESMCGWCVDRFGVSWQIVPKRLIELIGGPDADGAKRATEAMLKMRRIDIAQLEAAYRG